MTEPALTNPTYLSNSIALGVLTLVVLVLISRGFQWRSYAPRTTAGQASARNESRSPSLERLADRTAERGSLLSVAYLLTVLGFLTGTVAAVTGILTVASFLTALGVAVATYLVFGLHVSGNIRRTARRWSYRMKRSVLFRRRPLWSMLVAWATVLVTLTVVGIAVVGLWTLAGGSDAAFVGVLAVFGTVVVIYAASSAGVALRPKEPISAWRRSTDETTSRPIGRSAKRLPVQPGELVRGTLERVTPILRGWLGVSLLLVTGASVMAVVWVVTGGGTSFLAGLLVIAIGIVAYAVTSAG